MAFTIEEVRRIRDDATEDIERYDQRLRVVNVPMTVMLRERAARIQRLADELLAALEREAQHSLDES